MKSIMSRVGESTEQALRKHLAGITMAQLVRKVPLPTQATPATLRVAMSVGARPGFE
jgi:hypothetical protein